MVSSGPLPVRYWPVMLSRRLRLCIIFLNLGPKKGGLPKVCEKSEKNVLFCRHGINVLRHTVGVFDSCRYDPVQERDHVL